MFSSIDPVYVVLLLLVVVGAAGWYVYKKKQPKQKAPNISQGQFEVDSPFTPEQNRANHQLADAISGDEPEVPVLSPVDQKVVETPASRSAPKQESLDLPPAVPEYKPVADLVDEIKPHGHRLPHIDTGVEAVLHFTPAETPSFDPERLAAAEKSARALEMPFPLQFSFYSAQTGLWTEDAASAEDCREFYISTLTANRSKKMDSLAVSHFLGLGDRLAIDLGADAVLPDADQILSMAEKVNRIAQNFSSYLTFKLVGARDIDDSAFNEAALGCGFVYSEGHYEKRDPGVSDPAIVLGRMPQLKNELGLGLNIPLSNPAANPLGDLCAVANDLACRLDLELADPYGAPLTPASASGYSRQLASRYREMDAAGIPAGSQRARRIFSGA